MKIIKKLHIPGISWLFPSIYDQISNMFVNLFDSQRVIEGAKFTKIKK